MKETGRVPLNCEVALMRSIQRLKNLIAVYLAVLLVLLLCVTATPLLIRHGISVARDLVIGEEVLETLLIVILFAVSFFIWRAFGRALRAYGRIASRAGEEKSRLISRLNEAFSYIGTVNVEIKEIESILCGVEHYPQSKREFKELLDDLAAKAMTVAGVPWIVIRMINRHDGRTIKEHTVQHRPGSLPSVTMGNREILEGRHVEGLRMIAAHQKNIDLLTVCIFPEVSLSEEDIVLIAAIVNQLELFFILYRTGCFQKAIIDHNTTKETYYDTHH